MVSGRNGRQYARGTGSLYCWSRLVPQLLKELLIIGMEMAKKMISKIL